MLGQLPSRPVSVVRIDGTIGVAVKAHDFVPLFERLRRRQRTRAVVVDVDSRGGSASVSDYIWDSLRRLALEKPVVAFAGNICASGGYLIACAAQRIIVQPGAIVGSIGVISARPMAAELMQKIGLSMTVNKSSRLKDMGAFWREPTEEEVQREQALVNEYFELFLDRVEAGRTLSRDQLRSLATGEVYTGRQAVELGLADQLGNLEDAVRLAAGLAGVKPKPLVHHPRRGLRQRVIAPFAAELTESVVESTLRLTDAEPRF